MVPLFRKLDRLWTHYAIDRPMQVQFEAEVEQLVDDCFAVPRPLIVDERSYQERSIVQSIRYHLENQNLVLRRTANDQNLYYLGNRTEYHRLVKKYMHRATNYERTDMEESTVVENVATEINRWYEQKWINEEQWTKMNIQRRKHRELPLLYFLPRLRHPKGELSVEPRLSSYRHGPIVPLAHFLYGILQPLFENATQVTTAPTHRALIQRLQQHCVSADSFEASTQFVTFHFEDIYQQMDHSRLLVALHRFLQHPTVRARDLPLDNEMLERIAAFVVNQQWFIFDKRCFRYRQGGLMNLPLIQLLADIYIHDWQSCLVRHIRVMDAFYCRYHCHGVFTWTDSTQQVRDHFLSIERQYADLHAKITIGQEVAFLDATLQNRHGRLITSVFHDPAEQPFLLPFVTDYPRIQYRQWFRFAFIRALVYCNQVDDFQRERLYTEATLLANGYSLEFVEHLAMQFFDEFPFLEQHQPLTGFVYGELRRRLIRRLEELESDARENVPNSLVFTYLYDWGHRSLFNHEFRRRWSGLLEQNERLRQANFRLVFKPKHIYLSNTLFNHR